MKIRKRFFKFFKIIILFLLLMVGSAYFLLPLKQLQAQENQDEVSQEEIKEKIKEKLENIVEKNFDASQKEATKSGKLQIYAWVGKVEDIKNNKLSLQTYEGLKEAEINKKANIFLVTPGKARQNITADKIEIGNYVIAMGPKNEEIIDAKRIIVLKEQPSVSQRRVLSGKVVEVDTEEKQISIKNGTTETLTITKNTKLKITGIKAATIEDIKIDDNLAAIVILDKNGKINETKAVLVIPKENSTSSLEKLKEESATKSATSSSSF